MSLLSGATTVGVQNMGDSRTGNVERIVFGQGERGTHHLVPEILEIGWGRFMAADYGHLRPHRHRGAFEICLIIAGEVDWETPTGSYTLRAGDIFITRPDEEHWGQDSAMHPCELHWMIVGAPSHGYAWGGLPADVAALLEQKLGALPSHRLRAMPHHRRAMEEIYTDHRCLENADHAVVAASARASLWRLLIDLVRQEDDRPADMLPRTADALLESLRGEPASTSEIKSHCTRLGLNYRDLNRRFSAQVGCSISQYWLRERVRSARDRLANSDENVTDIATELGFSSSQHFATTFRKITGLTPSEFRRQAGTPIPPRDELCH